LNRDVPKDESFNDTRTDYLLYLMMENKNNLLNFAENFATGVNVKKLTKFAKKYGKSDYLLILEKGPDAHQELLTCVIKGDVLGAERCLAEGQRLMITHYSSFNRPENRQMNELLMKYGSYVISKYQDEESSSYSESHDSDDSYF